MPLFDFQCGQCGRVFEFQRPFGSKTRPACPSCKSKRTEKLMTPPAIQFKGKGFYKTDSRPLPAKGTKKAAPKKAPEAKPDPPCTGDCATCPSAE